MATAAPPKAEHPFAWAGYLLIDTGVPPEKPEGQPAGPPTIKPIKPLAPAKK